MGKTAYRHRAMRPNDAPLRLRVGNIRARVGQNLDHPARVPWHNIALRANQVALSVGARCQWCRGRGFVGASWMLPEVCDAVFDPTKSSIRS